MLVQEESAGDDVAGLLRSGREAVQRLERKKERQKELRDIELNHLQDEMQRDAKHIKKDQKEKECKSTSFFVLFLLKFFCVYLPDED